MTTQGVQYLSKGDYRTEERLRQLEGRLRDHIERETGHRIDLGFHRWVYDGNLETYTIYDGLVPHYRETVKLNDADPSMTDYKTIEFFIRGSLYRRYLFQNFQYEPVPGGRIIGMDVVQSY